MLVILLSIKINYIRLANILWLHILLVLPFRIPELLLLVVHVLKNGFSVFLPVGLAQVVMTRPDLVKGLSGVKGWF